MYDNDVFVLLLEMLNACIIYKYVYYFVYKYKLPAPRKDFFGQHFSREY